MAGGAASTGASKRLRLLRWPLFVCLALCLTGRTAPAQDKPGDAPPLKAVPKVIVLPPQVIFEEFTARTAGPAVGGGDFEPVLSAAASDHLTARNYVLVTPGSLENPDAADWLKQLQPLSSRLARGIVNDEARGILAHFAALPEDYLIFVQIMKLKKGPGSSWNPMTGQITTGMASTLLQAALISVRTGEVTWKSEQFERKVYRAGDPKLTKLLDLLYKSLGNGGNAHEISGNQGCAVRSASVCSRRPFLRRQEKSTARPEIPGD